MHICESIIASTAHGQEILVAGTVAAAGATAVGLYKLDYERIPRAAVLSSAFFVVSLIHVPLGPIAVHLMLSGLMGLLLGWSVFPALLIALLLQSLFLPSFAGLTALGLNTVVMGLPGLACYYLFRCPVRSDSGTIATATGFAAGATGILLAGVLGATVLLGAGEAFAEIGFGFLLANLPLAVIEGAVTANVVVLLRKVRPELLEAPLLLPAGGKN